MSVIPEIIQGLNVVLFVDNRFEMIKSVGDVLQGIKVVTMKQSSRVGDFALVTHS